MVKKIMFRFNLYRRYLYWRRNSCIFVHVPKAAGTTVNKAIYGKTLGHYSALEIEEKFPTLFKSCFSFSLVRNPWDRVLSAYRFACVGKTDTMGVHNPNQYKINEFKTFEKFVCEWLPNKNVRKLDFIFMPQHQFVCDNESKIMVDHLGKVEAMGETVAILNEKLNRKIKIGVENSTSSSSKEFRHYYSSPEMIDIVRSVYRRDVELFGYDFE